MTLTSQHQQLRWRIGGLMSLYAFMVRYLDTGIVSSLYVHTNILWCYASFSSFEVSFVPELLRYCYNISALNSCDSIFWTSTIGKYKLYPFINGLSDHDAQLLILSNGEKKEKGCHTAIKRKINKYTIADFQWKLSHEMWE